MHTYNNMKKTEIFLLSRMWKNQINAEKATQRQSERLTSQFIDEQGNLFGGHRGIYFTVYADRRGISAYTEAMDGFEGEFSVVGRRLFLGKSEFFTYKLQNLAGMFDMA